MADEEDSRPVPGPNFAAMLEAMMAADDPFNTKNKSSPVMLDDQPISSNKSKQSMSAYSDESESSQPIEPSRPRSKPPTVKSSSAAGGGDEAKESSSERRVPLRQRMGKENEKNGTTGTVTVAESKPRARPTPPPSQSSIVESMLETDDPFGSKKKALLMGDDVPIGGSKLAQSQVRAYDDDDSQPATAAVPVEQTVMASKPPNRLTARVPLAKTSRADTDSSESKEDDCVAVSKPSTRVSHAALTATMLETDDPFSSKKKALMGDDAPIGGNKMAQMMVSHIDDEPSNDSQSVNEEELVLAPKPPVKKRPPLKAHQPVKPAENEATDSADNETQSATSSSPPVQSRPAPNNRALMESMLETDDPFGSKKKALMGDDAPIGGNKMAQMSVAHIDDEPNNGSAEQRSTNDDESMVASNPPVNKRPLLKVRQPVKPAEPEAAADNNSADAEFNPVSFSSPAPRAGRAPNNRALMESMLETDDPFGAKKKSTMVGEDAPVGGNSAAQQMSSWMDEEGGDDNNDERPPPPAQPAPRRPPPKAAANDDDDAAASESINETPAPRARPLVKAKPKAKKEEEKKPAAATAATSASAAGGPSTAVQLKFEDFKGKGLVPFEESIAELETIVDPSIAALLASKKWNEQVDGLTKLTTAVEGLGADEAEDYLPSILSVLSKTPSFKAVNFNVCRGVYDCWAACLSLHLQSSVNTFDNSLVYHPISDCLNKLSDVKLVENVHRLFDTMAQCAGFKYLVNHIVHCISQPSFKILKAVESSIHWINHGLVEHGIGSIDAVGMIGQCHLWLQSTNKGTKDAATAILLTIYRQTGNILKEKVLAGLKPVVAKEIETQMAAIPGDEVGNLLPIKSKKGEPMSALNIDALIPRTDLSTLINEKLLKRMNDDNWKERDEAMKEIAAMIKTASYRIGPKDGGCLEVVGKFRLADKNKNLSRDALALVASFAQAMGKPVSNYRDKLVPNLFVCLADSKKLVKDEALKTLSVWIEIAGISSVAKYIPKALAVQSSRVELLQSIDSALSDTARFKKEKKDIDLHEWIPSMIACLQDRTIEGRAIAEKVTEKLMAHVGFDSLMDYTKNLKKAEVLKIQPVLEKIRKSSQSEKSSASATQEVDEKPAPAAATGKAAKAAPVAAKGKVGASKAAAAKAEPEPAATAPVAVTDALPIRKIDMAAKSVRVKRDAKRVKGTFREWGNDEIEELNEKAREFFSDAVFVLWSHKDFVKNVQAIDALETMTENDGMDGIVSVLDLLFKYFSLRLCDSNPTLNIRILAFLSSLLARLSSMGHRLHEGEVYDLFPFLIEKVLGHNNTKFRTDSRELITRACECADEKLIFTVVTAGMESKSKRVQSECIEISAEMIIKYGMAIGDSKKILLSIANNGVGAGDAGVRASALTALGSIYERIGDNIYSVLGGGKAGNKHGESKVPAKQQAMIEERFKRIKPVNQPLGQPQSSHQSVVSSTPVKKVSPPQSVQASPRPASLGGMRTPLKAGSIRGRNSVAPMFDNHANGSTDDSYVDDSEEASMNSSFTAPIYQTMPGRMSFSSREISAELPDCFSLDLDQPAVASNGASYTQPSINTSFNRPASMGVVPQSSPPITGTMTRPGTAGAVRPPSPSHSRTPSPALVQLQSQSSRLDFLAPLAPQLASFLLSNKDEDRIEGMKQLWESMLDKKAEIVSGQADSLVSFIASTVIAGSFTETFDPATGSTKLIINHRYCRYGLNTLMELFKVPELVSEVSVETLTAVTKLLLGRLMNDKLKPMQATDAQVKQLMQAINVLVLKVMENSERTTILHILIQSLKRAHAMTPAPNADPLETNPAYVDLIVRCLSKLIKTFQAGGMFGIDLVQLAHDIHDFLSSVSPALASVDPPDPSYRAVRSLLSLLVQVKGEAIADEMASIFPQSSAIVQLSVRTIASWKHKNNETVMPGTQQCDHAVVARIRIQKQQQQQQPVSVPQTNSTINRTMPSAAAPGSTVNAPATAPARHTAAASSTAPAANDGTEADLASIVASVLDPTRTKNGLIALDFFMQKHPHIDALASFEQQSESFKAYVRRQIAKIQQSRDTASTAAPVARAEAGLVRPSTGDAAAAMRQRLAALQAARPSTAMTTPTIHSAIAVATPSSLPPQQSSRSTFGASSLPVAPVSRLSSTSSSMADLKQRFAALNSRMSSS